MSTSSQASDDSDGWETASAASSDSELDFGGDISDDADAAPHRRDHLRFETLGVYQALDDARRAAEGLDGNVYTYDTRYMARGRPVTVYVCRSHFGCQHRVKIRETTADDSDQPQYELEAGGRHASLAVAHRRRGIHPEMRANVDMLIHAGLGAVRIRTLLTTRFANDPSKLDKLPTVTQLNNRRAYLVHTAPGGWDLSNYAEFNAWASSKLCKTEEEFRADGDVSDACLDAMIALDAFVIEATAEGGQATFGVVLTTRRVFRNVLKAVQDQGKELACSTDGTYKLHFGGWTVVDLGSESVTWSRNAHVHRFVPWAYMFVRSESAAAYSRMFEAVRSAALTFFDVDVNVAYASIDHSEAIASALRSTWPRVRILMCWPHLVRQARRQRVLLSDPERYMVIIKPDLDRLHSARSHEQFLAMSVIVTNQWIALGERDYANWFRSVYLTSTWEHWHANAGIPGFLPSQQGIEAHHSAIKKACAPSTRASTVGVITHIIPLILKKDGERSCPAKVAHVCEGPLPPDMLAKAKRLLDDKGNYRKIFSGKGKNRRIVTIIYNSTRHLCHSRNVIGAPVDEARSRRFLQSLDGIVADGLTSAELQFELLSLHKVSVKQRGARARFQHAPIWTEAEIMRCRSLLRCTCQSHAQSGWVCAHVLATLHLLGLYSVTDAVRSVPIRKAPGRPPTRRPALEIGDETDPYFSEKRLMKMFQESPGLPFKWKLVDDFDVVADGEKKTSTILGEVIGFRFDDGLFVWTARFDDGDLRDYTIQDLASAVHRAHSIGVQVTS